MLTYKSAALLLAGKPTLDAPNHDNYFTLRVFIAFFL